MIRDLLGRILLIRTATAGWELPGGRVEHGEDLVSALAREVMEECCCQISVRRLGSVTSRVGSPNLTILTFDCIHQTGEPQPGDDTLEARWFDPDAATCAVTHQMELLRLRDVLEHPQGVIYRWHDSSQNDSRVHEC